MSSKTSATVAGSWGTSTSPDPISTDGTPFYLGSVTGLKPTETGCHGPVLVEVDGGGQLSARRLALASLRWEERELVCSGLPDPATNLASHLLHVLRNIHENLENELDETRALGTRITLTGEVDDPAAVEKAVRDFAVEEAVVRIGETVLFVEKITSDLKARVDLAALARGDDPPGLLARHILALENPSSPVPGIPDPAALVDELVAGARLEIGQVDRQTVFSPLVGQDDHPPREEIVKMLARSGRLALAGMLAQPGNREASHAAE